MSLVGVFGASLVSEESPPDGLLPSLTVVVVPPVLLMVALSEGLSDDVPDAAGTVDDPGWVTAGVTEDDGAGAGVFVGIPALDVTEGTTLGPGPLPLGVEDCDEQPATNQGPATDKSNTDGKNDFIRVPGAAWARLHAP
jgi:hypothetical protein